MPIYNSYKGQETHIESGVPLGGIGTGKIELLPNGTLDKFTIFNNWQTPFQGWPVFYFALFVEYEGKKKTVMLNTADQRIDFPQVDAIRFSGQFPRAVLNYEIKNVPVDITLTAWAPFIPGDTKNSSLPAIFFDFSLKASAEATGPVRASVLAMVRNMAGKWCVGKYNEFSDNTLRFLTTAPDNGGPDCGDLALSAIVRDGQELSFQNQHNLKTNPFFLVYDNMSLDLVKEFARNGTLANDTTSAPASGERIDLGGSLAVSAALSKDKEQKMRFVYTWHMPNNRAVGHNYTTRFRNAYEVSEYVRENAVMLETGTHGFIDKVLETDIPDWLKDALLNNLYVLVSSTWYGKEKEFSLYEAPGICPLMGTLDVNYYSSVSTDLLFPELEKTHLRLFAGAQRPDGYIPHDLGHGRIDCPSDGTTAPKRWKDLNPKFILMCMRSWKRTNDQAFLEEIYPHCIRALEWIVSTDKNKDSLPDNEGPDQTFDVWEFFGANAYTSGIYLAALLAMEHMATAMFDDRLAKECRKMFKAGQKSYITQLWNGEYFSHWTDGTVSNHNCTCHQLNGQWYANLLDIEAIVPKDKIAAALKTINNKNAAITKFGVANSVRPDGSLDRESIQSGSVWPGECYAVASLMIQEGMTEEGLEIARKTWKMAVEDQAGPWNQADNIDAETGKYIFGDQYLRSLCVWTLVYALAPQNKSVKALLNFVYNA